MTHIVVSKMTQDDPNLKVAFSFGLAGSVKLNILEEGVDTLMEQLPQTITKIDQGVINRIRDRLYDVKKANLTINETPEYFWDVPQHEKLFEMAHAYCLTKSRIKLLNEKVMHESWHSPIPPIMITLILSV